jgi:predicted GH43/DUF377 family glycosyl hydrolase
MIKPQFERHPENPIVRPGRHAWRRAAVFNPAVLYDEGRYYMYERTAGGLRPFHNYIGMLESDDGVHFTQVGSEPVITPAMLGSEYGSVQDPRIVKIGDEYLMTVAYRPYAWECMPTGVGVPDSRQVAYPGFSGRDEENQSRSAVLRSRDRAHWELAGWVNPTSIDDRNVILFPEKIGGRYAVVRRPQGFVATDTSHSEEHPAICMSFSDDLVEWTAPEAVACPAFEWESNRIGGSTPPICTAAGWLFFYHGVETVDASVRQVVYRMGAMMLDANDPRKVIARCPHFLMEPEEYYEHVGLFIPHVVFPTAAVVVAGVIHLYYGVCDTAIALATVALGEVVTHVMQYRWEERA